MSAPSDSLPPVLTLSEFVEGASWPGIPEIGPLEFQDMETLALGPPPAPAASAALVLYRLGEDTPALVLGSGEGAVAPIQITDAEGWAFSIPPVNPDVYGFTAGRYAGYFKVTDDTGAVWATHLLRQAVMPDPPTSNTP